MWFLIKIGSRVAPRIEKILDWGADKTEALVVARTQNAFSNFPEEYLDALKAYCYDLEIEGFKGDLPPLALEDVFVPLRIDSDPSKRLNRGLIKNIWDLLPKTNQANDTAPYQRLAIIAAPGYGKTTLTRYLTLSYANQSFREHEAKELIPVLLLFRTIHPQIQDQQTPALPDLIVQQIQRSPQCQQLQPSSQWFQEKLQRGQCLVMLDGLDEVPEQQREKVSQWANWQMQAYSTPIILTSRPHGYDSTLFKGMQRVGILDFTNDQKEAFIHKWYSVITRRQKWDILWSENQQKQENKRLSRELTFPAKSSNAYPASISAFKSLLKMPLRRDLAEVAPPRNPIPPSAIVI